MEIFPQWDKIQFGEKVSFVGQLLVSGTGLSVMATLDKPCRRILVKGSLPDPAVLTWTVLEATVCEVSPLTIDISGETTLFPVPPCDRTKLNQVIELCCGIGAFSSVCAPLGLHALAGVDSNPKWTSLYASLHSSQSHFIQGDCGSLSVLRQLLGLGGMHSIFLSGVSCQPFSIAGDRRGLLDPRSSSLPSSLRAAWLAQAPILVLECTPEIKNDPGVQAMLKQYQGATGCYVSQQLVALQDVWCTKRDRWFAVLSAAPLGPIPIPQPPALRGPMVVGDVMPFVLDWPEDVDQLQLSLYELSRYYTYANPCIQKAFLDLKAKLPTLLHSCGNQLYDCQCGCRKALSHDRIASRGLFGTIIPCGQVIYHENQHLQNARYLHPKEMFLLQGGSPAVDFGPNHRLAMAGIGQCVSPLIATWILAHVKVAIQKLVGEPLLNPESAFEDHMFQVLDARDELWPTPMDQADFMPGDHPVRIWDHDSNTMIQFKCSSATQIDNFLSAERALLRFLGSTAAPACGHDPVVWAGEQKCSFGGATLHSLEDLSLDRPPVCAPAATVPCCMEMDLCEVAVVPAVVSPTVPFSLASSASASTEKVDCPDLVSKSGMELLNISCPRLSSTQSVPTLMKRVLPRDDRVAILTNQKEVWADDEIRFCLKQLVDSGPSDQAVIMWDPLALSSVVRFSNFQLLQELVAGVPPVATVASACLIEGHWYAICWRCKPDVVLAFTCGHPCNMSVALQRVHQEFCSSRACPCVPLSFQTLPFVVDSCCGALAVAFLRHLIFAVDLPPSKEALGSFHQLLREAFVSSLSPAVPRPWVWGLGETTCRQKLELLLQEHGVPSEELVSRSDLVLSKLGVSKVEQAMASSSPWRDLKWLANSCVPQFQIIRPKELEAAIAQRAKSGAPVGTRAQKIKGKGKGKGSPKSIDPAGLRIESGLFECGNGHSLSQLDLTQIGPQASGIVLATLSAALPYLKGGRQISAGGLGLLVVGCDPQKVPSTLIPEPIRVPAICLANSEPVLLDAVLFQLGALPVARKTQLESCEIVTMSSSVVKILAFKDELDIDWATFVRHPMRHVFQRIPLLLACDDDMCQGHCESWHATEECKLANPLMELWSKQWLSLTYQQTSSAQAELFSVHVRVPAVLTTQLLTYSGVTGLYLEPKHVDGRQPSDAYQVFWLHRHSYQEALHVKQTTPHILGVARLGTKYGVRCRASCAQQVHGCLRPDGSFLPPGKKLHWMLGPLPYGTLRASLVSLLSSISWVARPLQPMATSAHISGVMWKIQSVVPPPVTVVSTDKGDVLITQLDDHRPEPAPSLPMVANPRTMDLCVGDSGANAGGAKMVDPLQVHDPWAVANRLGVLPSGVDPVQELERKVVDAVMAKLPKESMEIDSSEDGSGLHGKVDLLERQVKELRDGQQGLRAMIVDQGRTQGQQIAGLQQQTQQIEHAVTEHHQSLSSFQTQFSSQLAQQENRLDSLFRQQMERLEDLFAKKPRHE